MTAVPRRRVQGYDPGLACQCNTECGQHGNCCPDYDQECGGGGGGGSLTDAELRELSELLVRLYLVSRPSTDPAIAAWTPTTRGP